MAIVPVALRVETAEDLEFELNSFLAPLLSDVIFGVEIDQIKPGPFFAKNIYFAFTYSQGSSTTLTSPIQFKTFSQPNEVTAVDRCKEFIAANVGYFFSEIFVVYRPQNPNPEQGVIVGIFYSADPNASFNWGGGSGSGGGGVFVNPNPTTITVGGIPSGTTFPLPQTLQQMFDRLLYPYQAPAFTSLAITGYASPLEVGATIPTNVTFTWSTSNSGNVQPNTVDLLDVTGAYTIASGLANDGSEAVTLAAPVQLVLAGSYQFRVQATNTQLASFNRTLTMEWRWRLFAGTNAAPTITGPQIGALTVSALPTGYAGTYATPAGGYKYICWANAAGGQINSVKDQLTGFDVPMASVLDDPAYSNVDGGGFSYALVSYTNVFGVTTNYRVYRTKNSLGGAVTLVVT